MQAKRERDDYNGHKNIRIKWLRAYYLTHIPKRRVNGINFQRLRFWV